MFYIFLFFLFVSQSNGQLDTLDLVINDNTYANLEQLSFRKLVKSAKIGVSSLSQKCAQDLGEVLSGFSTNYTSTFKKLTLPMLDASAKLGPGVLKGHIHLLGLMTQCREIQYGSTIWNRKIEGEYFRICLDLTLQPHTRNDTCQPPLFITTDICLPKSCSGKELTGLFQSVPLLPTGNPICKVQTLNDPIVKPDTGTYIVGITMGLLLLTCIVSGIADFYMPQGYWKSLHTKKSWRCLIAFSLYRNISEIFHVDEEREKGQIRPLNCIRFFSIAWIICLHTYGVLEIESINPLDMVKLSRTYFGLLFQNVFFAVDSFFFISGLLLTFLWFKSFKKDQKFAMSTRGWILFYLHRFIRISAPYYLVLLFYTFIWQCLYVNMPVYAFYVDNPCRRNWWTNLLYLNNYIRHDEICYEISWYLSTDMQMFLFTPIVLIAFANGARLGYSVAGAIFLASTGIGVFQVYYFDLPPSSFSPPVSSRMKGQAKFGVLMYMAPYIRCQVYVFGMVCGYFMHSRPSFRVKKVVNVVMYLISFALMLCVVLGLHSWANGDPMSLTASAFYNTLSKVAWSLALAWIIITCYYGQGGIVNAFMSWSVWVPLGRLSFSAYLVHICAVTYILGSNQGERVYTSSLDLILNFFLPAVFYGFLAAVPWTAMCEMPFGKVEAILLEDYKLPAKKIVKDQKDEDIQIKL